MQKKMQKIAIFQKMLQAVTWAKENDPNWELMIRSNI